jgi:hypothetical protein
MTRGLARLVQGDLRERTRRYAFLVTVAFALWVGYLFLPPRQAKYVTLLLGDHRGIYNSAWVGIAIAFLTSAFLGLVGFYLVRDTVSRDRRTGVGDILAATPLSRLRYLASKALSNWLVLAAIALAVTLSAAVTQWVRAEDRHIDAVQLLAPYLLLTLPALALVAAVAVLFECVPGLRSGGGNVLYFFAWSFGMAAASIPALRSRGLDLLGLGAVLPAMERACAAAFPDYVPGSGDLSLGVQIRERSWTLSTFEWRGMEWSPSVIGGRLVWVAVAAAVVAVAAVVFDRFASAPPLPWRAPRKADLAEGAVPAPNFAEHYAVAAASGPGSPLARLARLVASEIRLTRRSAGSFWYIGLCGLWIAALVTPLETARLRVLPLVWLWPVLLWSGLGMRERLFGTDQILFSAPRPLALQLPAAWLGGAAIAVATGGPIGLRLLLARDWGALAAWAVGALFVPALALALGVWTGTSRAFEALYTALWYIGPLQPVPILDFMGASREAVARGMPAVYAALTALLLAFAFLGRKRQLVR